MFLGRARFDWAQTSLLAAILANIFSSGPRRSPEDFMPEFLRDLQNLSNKAQIQTWEEAIRKAKARKHDKAA